jgi:hypothetical protein
VSFADDLTELIGVNSPFTVTVVSGGTSSYGILDEPTSVVAGDQVLFVDRNVLVKQSDFGSLVGGDSITVDGVSYKVRTNEQGLDGLTCQISLEKV